LTAALNLDSAFGIAGKIPDNARLLRNLIQGTHVVQDHILHFYHLAALDYVDIKDVAKYEGGDSALNSVKDFIMRGELGPFAPRYEGDYRLTPEINQMASAHYIEALEIRRIGQEMVSLLSGKIPHSVGIVPGGVTIVPTVDMITTYLWKLRRLQEFIATRYLPDVLAIAGAYPDYCETGPGCRNLLSYGGYDLEGDNPDYTSRKRLFKQGVVSADMKLEKLDISKINESVAHSWYDDSTNGRHPSEGDTVPQYGKKDAYSWVKAPRYDGKVCEVGPLARLVATYASGDETVRKMVDSALSELKAPASALFSVMGRHLARALDAKIIAENLEKWLLAVKPGEPTYCEYEIPEEAKGFGISEAARGALGHWIEIRDKKIYNYQCVVPTTWNASPRDENGNPGPIEQAIIGTKIKDKDNPFEIVRIVRSFDPCLACAIH
jgi:hydrogenase large subunit